MTLEEFTPPAPDPAAAPSPDAGSATAAPDGDPASGDTEQGITITGTQVEGNLSTSNSAFYGDVYYMMAEQRRAAVRPFNFAHGEAVKKAQEQWAAEHFPGGEDEAAALVRQLEQRRVLVLSAEPGARKVTAAIHLAMRLRERGACTGSTLVFAPVDRHVQVDVHTLPDKHPELKDRVVIFRYPLSRGNPYLGKAFREAERAEWEQLAELLRERNAFLVFTATPAETERACGTVKGVLHPLHPHPPEVLSTRLDRHLAALRERGEAPAESLDALLGFREALVGQFSYTTQLSDFVHFFIDLGQPAPRVEEALARFRSTGSRLKQGLGEDFESWSFGLALALAQCTPDARAIAWVDFDRLRRHLRRWLQRDLQITSGTRDEPAVDEPSEVSLELSDESLLTRSRARVEKDPATLADVIGFCDGRSPQAVWRTLLERNRRVLTAILPRLRELAERQDADGRSVSVLAAQIIGRIGEIDCERVIAPMAEHWAASAKGRNHGLVGAMFEGVLGSDEPRYRALCLQHLKSMHTGSAEGRGKQRVVAAVAAYSWVGYYDFALAMRELYAILRTHLVPWIEDATRVSRLVSTIQHQIERAAAKEKEMGEARAVREFLRNLVERIYGARADLFLGMQFSLVSLCETQGVAPVLRELRDWIRWGGPITGVLIALMFLHERGIANQLREDRTEFPLGEGAPPASCGQFVRALANGEDDVYQAVRFLGDVHESVNARSATEAVMRQHFRERLQAHLLEWIREAVPAPELAAPMRSLVEQLSRTHSGKMRDLVMQLLNGPEFKRDRELREFEASLRL
ncbi:MAG TPA: hypothetical protein VFJ82_05930 [Longimicrobium sp.]|nr:hypothetical protein [Longimicrobium sp.]